MNRLVTNTLIVIFLIAAFWSRAQENIHVFPDRSSCLSGDTVWFNAFLFSGEKNQSGHVIHVQLDHLQGNHITKTSVSCSGSSAPGFLHVPDSLSTGVYVLKAFSNAQKGNPTTIVNQRYLLVYNRFDEDIYSILMPASTKTNFLAAGGINMRAEPKSGDTKELYV